VISDTPEKCYFFSVLSSQITAYYTLKQLGRLVGPNWTSLLIYLFGYSYKPSIDNHAPMVTCKHHANLNPN